METSKKTKDRALETVLQINCNLDGLKPREVAELRKSIRQSIELGDRAQDDYTTVLSALEAERKDALKAACGALCPPCKGRWGKLVVSNGTLYHFGGEIEYEGGGTVVMAQPCQAAAVRKLLGDAP